MCTATMNNSNSTFCQVFDKRNSTPKNLSQIHDKLTGQVIQLSIFDAIRSKSLREATYEYSHFDRCLANLFRVSFYSFAAVYMLVLIGSAVELRNVEKLGGTDHLYEGQTVCAAVTKTSEDLGSLHTLDHFVNFGNAYHAVKENATIAHCGDCGRCSSVQDIRVLHETKGDLTKKTTNCAMQRLLFGRDAALKCMDQTVGFTTGCNQCWVDNIECTVNNCKFTCLKKKYFSSSGINSRNDHVNGELDDCLKCDEKMCGPAFLECAGANRRRIGLGSDIGRSGNQICSQVDKTFHELMTQPVVLIIDNTRTQYSGII